MKQKCKIDKILVKLLRRDNLTMVQMAKQTGIKYGRIVSWKFKNNPKVGWELIIAAAFFKVSLSYLLYGVSESHKIEAFRYE